MRCLIAILMLALPAAAFEEHPHPPPGSPVELTGTIAKVQAVRGQGMPYLEVLSGGQTTRVHLGSMRYLLQNNFSPASGEKVEVEGFRRDDGEVVAKKIRLVKQGKTLNLRDGEGRPLWQRGRYGRGKEGGRGRLETEGKQ